MFIMNRGHKQRVTDDNVTNVSDQSEVSAG